MKNVYRILALLITSTILFSCKKEESVTPSGITNIQVTPMPGSIKITWEKQEPITFEYIKVTYFDKLKKKEMLRLASSFSNEIIIPNTRKKFGEYKFTLQPVSVTGEEGQVYTIEGISGIAPATYQFTQADDAKKVELNTSIVSTNAQEPTEGPIANLFDGNTGTFFHSIWSKTIGEPHHIQVNLPTAIQGFKYTFATRHNGDGGGDVKRMKVEVSNDGTNWEEVAVQAFELGTNAANDRRREFTASPILLGTKYTMFRFTPLARRSADPIRNSWFNMSEFNFFEEPVLIIDPEAPADGD